VFKFQVHRDQEESEQLVKELLASGATRAPATVLSLTEGRRSSLTGLGVKHQLAYVECAFAVQVSPEGEAPFNAGFEQILSADIRGVLITNPSDFQAIYDPANRERIALDTVTWREQMQREGEPWRGASAAFQQGGGVEGHMARVNSLIANGPGPLDLPVVPVAAPAVDPLAELSRLADLHDRGVVSDEEFATLKAKLLAP
jgi:hypothetical protein